MTAAFIASGGPSLIADRWSFERGTIGCGLDRTPETPEDRAVRVEGKRIRKAFPRIDSIAEISPAEIFLPKSPI
jgi:hypothetical protein